MVVVWRSHVQPGVDQCQPSRRRGSAVSLLTYELFDSMGHGVAKTRAARDEAPPRAQGCRICLYWHILKESRGEERQGRGAKAEAGSLDRKQQGRSECLA